MRMQLKETKNAFELFQTSSKSGKNEESLVGSWNQQAEEAIRDLRRQIEALEGENGFLKVQVD